MIHALLSLSLVIQTGLAVITLSQPEILWLIYCRMGSIVLYGIHDCASITISPRVRTDQNHIQAHAGSTDAVRPCHTRPTPRSGTFRHGGGDGGGGDDDDDDGNDNDENPNSLRIDT